MSYILFIVYSCSEVKEIEEKKAGAVPFWDSAVGGHSGSGCKSLNSTTDSADESPVA
jgi:hypothetical protein